MVRIFLSVVVGYTLWTLLWLTGSLGIQAGWSDAFAAFQDGQPITAAAPLLLSLLLSVVCSLAGGWSAAAVSQGSRPAVGVLAGLLLLTGVGVQASSWALMPVWYHLTFLALLVPVTLLGAARRAPAPVPA